MLALLALLLAFQADPEPSTAPDAKAVFQKRQEDLITLAGALGGLHRLNQLCPGYGRISIFRDRMKEIIDGERPPRDTREQMIANFNTGYRRMTRLHFTCSAQAEADFKSEAIAAYSVSERLSAPLLVR